MQGFAGWLRELVHTNSAAVANHSCVHTSIMASAGRLHASLAWPHPLPQRREGFWGLALQPAIAQEFNYLCNLYMM